MNRDEKRSRVAALPPHVQNVNGVRAVYPREPSGGTWISVNEHGVTLALINWHRIHREPAASILSRGQIVAELSGSSSSDDVSEALKNLPLRRFRPFRLMAVVPRERSLTEWRWNLEVLQRRRHPWQRRHWFSSGFDENAAELHRTDICRSWAENGAQTPGSLRELHQSHSPTRGPFSICMHRTDAVTLSYTEVAVSANSVTMRYFAGSPCKPGQPTVRRLSSSKAKTL